MEKFIIAIIAVFITTSAFSQNYFSEIAITNEFGSTVKVEKVNGRIYIKDSIIVIKTENGKIDTLRIIRPYIDGSKDEPSIIDGYELYYYDEGYYCDDRRIFVRRTFVTEYTHRYLLHYWRILYLDDDNEIIKTKDFAHPSMGK